MSTTIWGIRSRIGTVLSTPDEQHRYSVFTVFERAGKDWIQSFPNGPFRSKNNGDSRLGWMADRIRSADDFTDSFQDRSALKGGDFVGLQLDCDSSCAPRVAPRVYASQRRTLCAAVGAPGGAVPPWVHAEGLRRSRTRRSDVGGTGGAVSEGTVPEGRCRLSGRCVVEANAAAARRNATCATAAYGMHDRAGSRLGE